jgi:Stress responsive A/B Barrel Domain
VSAVYHVVLFTLREGDRAQLEPLLDDLRMLERLPMVQLLICGRAATGSRYDAGLVVKVAAWADLQAYREHPDHLPVVERLRTLAATLDVADFVA